MVSLQSSNSSTHALGDGIPAIDRCNDGCPCGSTDQRDVSRPQGDDCDTGSYEANGSTAVTLARFTASLAERVNGFVLLLALVALGAVGLLALRARRRRQGRRGKACPYLI